MYYLVEYSYVGPNMDSPPWEDYIEVRCTPGRTNMSNEERVEGWLGTTNDTYAYAHGEFDSIDEALAFGEERGFTLTEPPEWDQLAEMFAMRDDTDVVVRRWERDITQFRSFAEAVDTYCTDEDSCRCVEAYAAMEEAWGVMERATAILHQLEEDLRRYPEESNAAQQARIKISTVKRILGHDGGEDDDRLPA